MHDEFESSLKSKFHENLDLQSKDWDILDLVGMISEKRLLNMKNHQDEFDGFSDPELVKKILPLSIYRLHLTRSPDFLREMSLGFVISTFYSYLIDMIKEILLENQNLIEDGLDQNGDIELLAYNLGKDLTSRGISETSQRLRITFGLDLSSNEDWNNFREIFLRRNMFVHNNGIPNQNYINSYNVTSDRLGVNRQYLVNSINFLKLYQHRIENFFYDNLI